MAIKQETQPYDPFARAIPGQSFTEEQGLRPFERPPLETDPEKLYKVLDEQLNEESTATKLESILDIGISCETLSEVVVQKCFTEGVCSPDVAEIMKPFIFMTIAEIGAQAGVKNMELFNDNAEEEDISTEDKLFMMQQLSTERFDDVVKDAEQSELNDMEMEDVVSQQFMEDEQADMEEMPSDFSMEDIASGEEGFIEEPMDTTMPEDMVEEADMEEEELV